MQKMLRKVSCFLGISVLTLCVSSVASGSETNSLDWQFSTAANPSDPTVSNNFSGSATVTMAVGYLGEGWLINLLGFGSQTGLWDLGFQNPDDMVQDTRGRASIAITNAAPVSGSSGTELTLHLVQFVDGLMYKGGLTFSLPGETNVGRKTVEIVTGGLGGKWVEDTFFLDVRAESGTDHAECDRCGKRNNP